MDVSIQRLGAHDHATLLRLNACFAEAFEDPATYLGAPPDAARAAAVLGNDDVIALVAVAGGDVIGGLCGYVLHKLESARSEVYLYDLAVAEGWRRQGIATMLIERLCAIAKARGAWVVFVQADHGDEPAIALYTKLGTREDVLHFDLRMP